MKTIIIYFTADKKSFQVIRPSAKFDGSVLRLVQHVAKSNLVGQKEFGYRKAYHSFDVIDH